MVWSLAEWSGRGIDGTHHGDSSPECHVYSFFTIIIVLVIGGLTSMRGALVAALIVGIANSLGSLFLPWFYTLNTGYSDDNLLLIKTQGLLVKD